MFDRRNSRREAAGEPPAAGMEEDERVTLERMLAEARAQVARLEASLNALSEADLHPIAQLRRRRGMSQAALARAIGVSPPALCRIENSPGLAAREETRQKLAEVLGVPESALVQRS